MLHRLQVESDAAAGKLGVGNTKDRNHHGATSAFSSNDGLRSSALETGCLALWRNQILPTAQPTQPTRLTPQNLQTVSLKAKNRPKGDRAAGTLCAFSSNEAGDPGSIKKYERKNRQETWNWDTVSGHGDLPDMPGLSVS